LCFQSDKVSAVSADYAGHRSNEERVFTLEKGNKVVGLITPHRTYLAITKTRKGGQGLIRVVVPLMMMMMMMMMMKVNKRNKKWTTNFKIVNANFSQLCSTFYSYLPENHDSRGLFFIVCENKGRKII
jgi:hypothetical protein